MKSQDEQWLLAEKYNGESSEAFLADCARLQAGEPLAYVIGWTPFLDARIYLDSQPLIPRPETEYWAEQAITAIKAANSNRTDAQPLSILDLCAGSGAIGVAVAMAVPDSHITFTDIDVAHRPTIERNLTENFSINRKVFGERFAVVESDLFAAVAGTYDFILTNPPYIDPALDRTETAVKAHEPHVALYGGQAGLELIEQIITIAPKYLNADGQLWLEHEPEQVTAIGQLATAAGMHCTTHTDQYGLHRFSVLTMAK